MQMKLHIFDNGLISKIGHHYEYTSAVYEEWTSRGREAVIYSLIGQSDDINERFASVSLFTDYIYRIYYLFPHPNYLNNIFNLFVKNYYYLRDLKKLPKNTFSKSDVILIHTIDYYHLPAVFLWYHSLPPDNLPNLILLFRFTFVPNVRKKNYFNKEFVYDLIFKCFERSKRKKTIVYATDSEEIAREYKTIIKKMNILPIPHIPPFQEKKNDHPKMEGDTTFLYLGEARDDKGYYLLPEAIRLVLNRCGHENIRFIIQSNMGGFASQLTTLAKQKLSGFAKNVKIIDRVLDSNEYYHLMFRADVVLLPYRANIYYSRTSGIFAEALGIGKSVIVPDNTWMARQLKKYNGGGLTFKDNDPSSLAHSVLDFLKNKNEHKKKADHCASQWIKYHNAQNYVNSIEELLRHL